MKFIKKYLKFIIGIAVLIAAFFLFFGSQQKVVSNLENGTLKDWPAASLERRESSVKMLIAGDMYVDVIVACVDKMATLPDSSDMAVRDAVSLCYTGIQLKDSI